MHSVRIKFNHDNSGHGRQYWYQAPDEWACAVGDILLVNTPSTGITAVTVTEVSTELNSLARVAAICKPDLTEWRREQEINQAVDRLNRQIDARMHTLRMELTASELAERDNRLAQLLEERSMYDV